MLFKTTDCLIKIFTKNKYGNLSLLLQETYFVNVIFCRLSSNFSKYTIVSWELRCWASSDKF